MAFSGTTQKCKACEKTVYLMDQLNADGVVFHRSCFKCTHCKKTLQLSNYSSLREFCIANLTLSSSSRRRGATIRTSNRVRICYQVDCLWPFCDRILYCFAAAKPVEKVTPELTRSPSKAASMFSGTQEKCATCGKTAYPLETVTVEGQSYHKSCFKCSHGGCPISPSNYAALEGILYCKHHFSQLFKEKGSYNHLIKSASIKRAAATNPVADS
uniref:LIM zinc-binding domain-containing protein n=1 Tax=Ananas comosus var. bracteatus TaxID=296719 RepID=A0A6V7QVT2_ANACO